MTCYQICTNNTPSQIHCDGCKKFDKFELMSNLKLSTEEKDIYCLSADPWGQYELESNNLQYVTIDKLEGLQCRNQENKKEIANKCAQVVKLIEEIEQLNK